MKVLHPISQPTLILNCMQNLHHLIHSLKCGGSDGARGGEPPRSDFSRFQDIALSQRLPGPMRSTIDKAWAAAQLLSKSDGAGGAAGSVGTQPVAPQPHITPHFRASHAARRGTPRQSTGAPQERGGSVPSREGSYVAAGMDPDAVLQASGKNPVPASEGRSRSADTGPHHGASGPTATCATY